VNYKDIVIEANPKSADLITLK